MIKAKIGVIIATSMKRIEELFNRSLKSILSQTVPPNCIVVIDDNTNNTVSDEIKKRICSLQNPLVHYIPNCHTKNMSGTGAWNTGIEFLAKKLGTK